METQQLYSKMYGETSDLG